MGLRLSQLLCLLQLCTRPNQDLPRISSIFKHFPEARELACWNGNRWAPHGLREAINDLLTDCQPQRQSRHPIQVLSKSIPCARASLGSLRLSPETPAADDPAGKSKLCASYWGEVWRRRPPPPPQALDSFLRGYTKKIDSSLLHLPDIEDIEKSIRRSNNSTPGPDGIPFAAWRAVPDLAGPVLFGVLNALSKRHRAPEGYNHGLLFLLPKKATGLVEDTRPLSVTNTDNRLLASTVARVAMPAVLQLVSPSQKGFLTGVESDDHIVEINSFFYEAVSKKESKYLFLLDTAKAFDSIDHEWIHKVLKRTEFPFWFTSFVEVVLDKVKVSPSFGSKLTEWIDITRGVKQGCPLSPLLFIICYDPLISSLGKLSHLCIYAFADDIAITTLGIAYISPALELLDEFSRIAGLGINRSKSCVVPTAHAHAHPAILREIAQLPWRGLPLVQHAKYLGIPIGRDITLEDIWKGPVEKAIARLELAKPFLHPLTVPKRILFVNTFIIPFFSYIGRFFALPTPIWKVVKRAISLAVIPFHGGAYPYTILLCVDQLFGIKPALKDVWAAGISLLAVRSPVLRSGQLTFPTFSMRTTKFIVDHRNAAAKDFISGYHGATPACDLKSPDIYRTLVAQTYLPEASQLMEEKITRLLSHCVVTSDWESSMTLICNRLKQCKNLPAQARFNQFALLCNALATSRRTIHQRGITKEATERCFLCGTGEDSLVHLFDQCQVVANARILLLGNNFPLCLASSCLLHVPDHLVPKVVALNYAVWSFRKPALAGKTGASPGWAARSLASIALVHLSKKKKIPRNPDSVPDNFAVAVREEPYSYFCFTDGSASPNPGPCGAGVCIFPPDRDVVIDCGSHLGLSTNNVGEITAIGICCKELLRQLPVYMAAVVIFCDSLYAISVIEGRWKASSHRSLILSVRESLETVRALTSVKLVWVKAHSTIGGNNRVDLLAKKYASSSLPPSANLTYSTDRKSVV